MQHSFDILNKDSSELQKINNDSSIQKIEIDFSIVQTKKDLLDQYHQTTGVAYMAPNWDSLEEVLQDCEWMKKDHLCIIHKGISLLPNKDLEPYKKILKETLELHKEGPRENFSLPQRKIDLRIVFVYKDADEEKKINDFIKT
jgi:hypothetical protein